jgi:hypothetical protein
METWKEARIEADGLAESYKDLSVADLKDRFQHGSLAEKIAASRDYQERTAALDAPLFRT